MFNNKYLKETVNERLDNNDSKEFILGFVSGLYVGCQIDFEQLKQIQRYIDKSNERRKWL